jgi:hypothetical protein
MPECCNLVGDLNLGLSECIISISNSCSPEIITGCTEPKIGPNTGTVSITGYATLQVHTGCPGRASVSLPWIRKYDCETDKIYFIGAGEGQSILSGDTEELVSIKNSLGSDCVFFNASSSSGPATIYSKETQYNGYGMVYTGKPIAFSTTGNGVTTSIFSGLLDVSIAYMQSFSVTFDPGNLPTASYSFVYQVV